MQVPRIICKHFFKVIKTDPLWSGKKIVGCKGKIKGSDDWNDRKG